MEVYKSHRHSTKPSKLSFWEPGEQKKLFLNQTRKRSPRSSSKSPREDVLENIRVLRDKLKNISIREKTETELQEYKKEIEKLMEKCHKNYHVSEHVKDSFCNVLIPYLHNINNKLEFNNL